MKRRAFTLLELLIVVAILGILGAIVYVLLGGAREKSKQVVCISNLRQIGIAVAMYRSDYDMKGARNAPNVWQGLGVPKNPWQLYFGKYITDQRIHQCPDDPERPYNFSYAWCAGMADSFPMRPVKPDTWSQYKEMGESLMVAEDENHWDQYYARKNDPDPRPKRFWLTLRLNGAVKAEWHEMPRTGGCGF